MSATMGNTRRKKKRTQNPLLSEGEPERVPQSFVIARGKLPPLIRQLQQDLRKLMMPHTALHLKDKKRNTLKDFLHVAGPLGVTHLLILSHTQTAAYLRVARCPRGPTVTFKIQSYSLIADIARAQLRPRAPAGLFKNSPLIVLAGFGSEEEHLKLTTIMFQNIFPAINVKTVKLATCQRVVLLSYNKETKLIEFRHYSITLQATGVSRPLRKLVQHRKIPDLRGLGDVSEFITRAGYGSESEAEDEAATVQLATDIGHLRRTSEKSAVKLHEIGPRMTLQLVKVEEGICSGDIIFHEYVKKTPEEIAALKERKATSEALRKQRRAEQEANVRRKELAKQSQKRIQSGDRREEKDPHSEEAAALEEDLDDLEWYRQEVGQEPDAEFLSGTRSKARGLKGQSHAKGRDGYTLESNVVGKGFRQGKANKDEEEKTPRKRKKLNDTDEKVLGKRVNQKKFGKGIADKILSQRKLKTSNASFAHRKKRRTDK